MKWVHQSACLKVNPEIFFPIGDAGPARSQMEEAKLVCVPCQVKDECLTWALESGVDHGVLGGMTEHERREIRRSRIGARQLSASSG